MVNPKDGGSSITISRITVTGDVRLILTDGCDLKVSEGIGVGDGKSQNFSTASGNAFIVASSIGDISGQNSDWSGTIITGSKYSNGQVSGGVGRVYAPPP